MSNNSITSHNPFQIALRTYLLSLSLSLGPSILPLLVSARVHEPPLGSLKRILKRELASDSFASSITLAVAGGAFLRRCCRAWIIWNDLLTEFCNVVDGSDPHSIVEDGFTASPFANIKSWFAQRLGSISPEQETFISYVVSSFIGVSLLQAGTRRNRATKQSPTLDLTLLLLVQAVDSLLQNFIIRTSSKENEQLTANETMQSQPLTGLNSKLERKKWLEREKECRQRMVSSLDAALFWACSARIMWCFVYKPHRLHKTYVIWIQKLANLDRRIVQTLRLRSTNNWTYQSGSSSPPPSILEETCKDLGYPPSWGNPSVVPAYGGKSATEVWENLGVKGRDGVGGVPCEVLHYLPSIFGKAGENSLSTGLKRSCTANAVLRMGNGFLEAMTIYLPVHIFPVLLTNPQTLLRPHRLLQTLLGSIRSSAFLSSFIALFWFSVCLVRTVFFARLLPFVSHNFWDGPLGGIMAACLTCGCSIWIENARRRGEMALYILPKALRTFFPEGWIRSRNRWGFRIIERLALMLSLATLLTVATHRPNSLRGLSRWTLAFIINGPNAGFWKRR